MIDNADLDILADPVVNYDIGKYLIAINAGGGPRNINYFEYYQKEAEKLEEEEQELREELDQWNAMSREEKKEEVTTVFHSSKEALEQINQSYRESISGMSQAVSQLNQVSMQHEIPKKHFNDDAFQVSLLEKIQNYNTLIKQNKELIEENNVTAQTEEEWDTEIDGFQQDVLQDIEAAVSEKKQMLVKARVMINRKEWVSQTFDISLKEIEEIINQFNPNASHN